MGNPSKNGPQICFNVMKLPWKVIFLSLAFAYLLYKASLIGGPVTCIENTNLYLSIVESIKKSQAVGVVDVPPPAANNNKDRPVPVKLANAAAFAAAEAAAPSSETGKTTKGIAASAKSSSSSEGKVDVSDLREKIPNVIIRTRDDYKVTAASTGRCKVPSGRRILINYGANCCKIAQPRNCETGLTIGGFDVCISYNDTSLDEEFKKRNAKILTNGIGGGYWMWKPYIIFKTLNAMTEDDVLLYTDAGSHFVANMDTDHVCLMEKLGQDVVPFSDGFLEHTLTKPDAFILMDADRNNTKYYNGMQTIAAFFMARKTFRAMHFVGQWMTYAQDLRIIGNDDSKFAKNPSDYRGHRNDQSILSLLTKKWDIEPFPDPSQWGEYDYNLKLRQKPRFKDISKTYMAHTRDKA